MPASPPKCSWPCLQVILLALLAIPVQAVILVTGDNSANQTAPDAARADIFHAVAKVCDASGGGAFGSAVRLRGKYLLTARHVSIKAANHVTFDGSTIYQRDAAFEPVQIGTADLQLFKLVEDPGFSEVKLFDAAGGDLLANATIVGVGVGRDPNDTDGNTTWNWGSTATMAKRWGQNRVEGVFPVTPEISPPYSYEALETTLEVNDTSVVPPEPLTLEAAVTIYDSGCGLFIEHMGEWKLAGIAVLVSTSGSSTFSDVSGDRNYYVRINQLAAAIEAEIPDLSTYSGWKVDHSLYDGDANDDADTDGDGIPQLIEFALGGDPNQASRDILPAQQLTEDGGNRYLELVVTRPIGLQGLNYVPQTTTDLEAWPTDSTGILNPSPTPTDNGDGTETLIYRRAAAVSANQHAFIRLRVETS